MTLRTCVSSPRCCRKYCPFPATLFRSRSERYCAAWVNLFVRHCTKRGLGTVAEVFAMVPKRQPDNPRCSTCNDEMDLTVLFPQFGRDDRLRLPPVSPYCCNNA